MHASQDAVRAEPMGLPASGQAQERSAVPLVAPSQASFADTLKAVSWSFFGVRARRSHERDVARLNPLHVIITGVLLAVIFVLSLIAIVKFVVS